MGKRKYIYINEKSRFEIIVLFFRTILINDEKIIDNSTKYISEKLNINYTQVNEIISNHLNLKFILLNIKINKS